MKNRVVFILCMLSFVVISCDKDEAEPERFTVQDFSATNFPQQWKLVATRSAMIPNAEITKIEGDAERYIFNEDYTFQKKSKIDGETIIVEGTFSIDERDFIILEYLEESSIIKKCNSQSKKEFLYFSEGQLINSTAVACDWPYFYYERVD